MHGASGTVVASSEMELRHPTLGSLCVHTIELLLSPNIFRSLAFSSHGQRAQMSVQFSARGMSL